MKTGFWRGRKGRGTRKQKRETEIVRQIQEYDPGSLPSPDEETVDIDDMFARAVAGHRHQADQTKQRPSTPAMATV